MTLGYANYRPPPPPPLPPVRRVWFWLALTLALGGFVATVVALAAFVVLSSTDSADYIEDPDILQVVESECASVRASVHQISIQGSPTEQAAAIIEQNHAIEHLVQAVRGLDASLLRSDLPTLAWTDDWELLIKVRSDYAQTLEAGSTTPMAEPTDPNGNSIIERMNFASEPECTIPKSLFHPYPVDAGEAV